MVFPGMPDPASPTIDGEADWWKRLLTLCKVPTVVLLA
jgi:hypothetical protein